MSKRKVALLLAMAGLLVTTAAAAVFWQVQQLRNQPVPAALKPALASQLDMLYSTCVKDMIASTCKVMGTSAMNSAGAPAKPGELVFIAGVGAIAATDYQQMYEAGDAMCSVVRQACTQDWRSSRCTTARKLLMPS